MNDLEQKNEYSMAGWLAIAAAVLTLPMFGLGFAVDIIGARAPHVAPILLLPYLAITICHAAFSIYAFLRFRALLNLRHAFHDVDALMTAIVIGVIMITVIGIPMKVLGALDLVELPIVLAFVGFLLIFAVTMGVLSMIFAIRLLRLENDLNGLLKPYAYITIAAAACFALFITAPLGLILDAAGNVVLGMIFLKPQAEESHPEFV